MTTGHTLVMGRKTWESLPIQPLPNRRNIVLTRQKNLRLTGAEVFNEKKKVLDSLLKTEETFVIGGGEIYRLFWNEAEMLHITRILADFEADTFFPNILEQEWKMVESIPYAADEANPYNLLFQTFIRLKKQ